MNKSDLVDYIAPKAGVTKNQAAQVIDAFVDGIAEALAKNDRVLLVGFGTFSVSKREARVGRNPQTGKPLNIEAKNVVRFKVGKKLSDACS
ncbi:MAG: HU family DNA-binding protein [Chitinophagaceae bacterium]|nr:HU family DNA-binding protein [Chitinophagaceae bacterium]